MHADHNATTTRRVPSWIIVTMIAAAAIGVIAYRPHVVWPFDVIDFSEFLPLLEQHDSFVSRLGALDAYYAQHGRFNVLQYAGTVMRWMAFGDWTPGWQLTRMVVMLGVIGSCGMLLRRLGASRLGAAAGAAFFLLAPPASTAWVRLTTAEPLATLIVIAMTLRALGFQERRRWGPDVVVQAGGAAVLLLLKEMFLPLLLLPLLAALVRCDGGRWRFAPVSRRSIVLVASVACACLVVAIPILLIYRSAPATGYVSLLGVRWMSPGTIVAVWLPLLLPFPSLAGGISLVWFVAMVSWFAIMVVGWGGLLRTADGRRFWLPWLVLCLAWPLIGVAIYAPWPVYASFYAIPYLLGPAALLAFALTSVQRHAAHGTRLSSAAVAAIGLLCLTEAHQSGGRRHANQVAADRLIEHVAGIDGIDSVFFASVNQNRLDWTGPGQTMARHATATHRPWPPTAGMPCDTAAVQPRPRTVLIWYSYRCTPGRGPVRVSEIYRYVEWRRWQIGADTITARVEVLRGGG